MKWFVAILMLLPHYTNAQQYGWVRVGQAGTQTLQAVEFVDSLHGWTAAGASAMYRTTDGGNIWTPYDAAAGFIVSSISMRDTAIGWAVGSPGLFDGTIIRTSDGGRTWTLQRRDFLRVYVGSKAITALKNTTSGYARNSPDTGKIVQTSNGGTSWTERTILDSLQDLRKMQFIDSLHGWIVGGSPLNGVYAVLRTTDGGVNWQVIRTTVGFHAVSFIDTLNGWSIRRDSPTYCYRTTDGGLTWMQRGRIEDPMWDDLSPAGFSFVDSLNGWAFGSMFYQGDVTALIFRTTDGGVSWYKEHVGGARGVTGMMLDRYYGWAVGTAGSVFAYRIVSGVPERLDRLPKSFALKQNYPNPFNPNTTIEYEIVKREFVTIQVYDTQGQEVRTLVNSEHEQGVYRIHFNATGLASGVYYYTMKTHLFTETKQMVLIR